MNTSAAVSRQMPVNERPPDAPSGLVAGAGRFDYIDGLRAVACLMVIFCHLAAIMPVSLSFRHLPGVSINPGVVTGQGYGGVNLFLLLSGFCLYWPFVKPNAGPEPTLGQFAARRCRRILPPYYVACVIGTLMDLYKHVSPPSYLMFRAKSLLVHLALLQSTIPGYLGAIGGHLWSIPLEFECYILFPIFVELYRRFPPRWILGGALAFNALYRLTVVHALPGLDFRAGFEPVYILVNNVFGRFFEFALGMFCARLIADWNRTGKSPLTPIDLSALALGIVGFCLLVTAKNPTAARLSPLGDIAWGLFFAGPLLLAGRPKRFLHGWLTNPWLARLGVISYSVYLMHLFVLFDMQFAWLKAVRHFGHSPNALIYAAYAYFITVPLTIAIGYGFHLLFERPFLSNHARREIAAELRDHPATAAPGTT